MKAKLKLKIILPGVLIVIIILVCTYLFFGLPWQRIEAVTMAKHQLMNVYLTSGKVVKNKYILAENSYIITLKDSNSNYWELKVIYEKNRTWATLPEKVDNP